MFDDKDRHMMSDMHLCISCIWNLCFLNGHPLICLQKCIFWNVNGFDVLFTNKNDISIHEYRNYVNVDHISGNINQGLRSPCIIPESDRLNMHQ